MKLADLMTERRRQTATATWDTSFGNVGIAGLTADSRAVERGYLFAALPGSQIDGRALIPHALKAGASAVLSARDVDASVVGDKAALITDPEPRRQLAWMADRFYDDQPSTQIAVTGTNGKTSVAFFVQQIWTAVGRRAVSMGTLGARGPGVDRYGALTTPDPVTLHRDLADLTRAGIEYLAIEASSHGLDQFRLDGLRLQAAGFTNLSRDHIDYHGSMKAYLGCKLRLFTDLMPKGATAVVNTDSDVADDVRRACKDVGLRVLPYGRSASDEGLVLKDLAPTASGQRLTAGIAGEITTIELPLAGDFQAWNALCALGLALATGVDKSAALKALEELQGAPGRLEHIGSRENGAAVYVDYAHTPGALETVLKALRPHTKGNLVAIFGCGGDRDPGKRPMMGAAAKAYADKVIVTDDNPRSEEPATIRAAALKGCPDATEIGDRRTATFEAVAGLKADDVLVVAGKGHEQGQIVSDRTLPFDDATVAREAIGAADGTA